MASWSIPIICEILFDYLLLKALSSTNIVQSEQRHLRSRLKICISGLLPNSNEVRFEEKYYLKAESRLPKLDGNLVKLNVVVCFVLKTSKVKQHELR